MNTLKTFAAALALAGLCSGAAHASGSLTVTPATTNATVGDLFSVQVRGTSFTDSVVGGGFNLSFNAGVLSLNSVQVNTAVWDFLSAPGTINNVAGTLSDTYFNAFNTLPTGNFAVATLNFTAKAAGSSALTLSGSSTFPFANDLIEVINVSYGSGLVNVAAVPEPATWASLGLGLALLPALLPALRRRRQLA